jgi:hypothetical protein
VVKRKEGVWREAKQSASESQLLIAAGGNALELCVSDIA